MAPIGGSGSAMRTPWRRSRRAVRWIRLRAWRISPTEVSIGSRMRIEPCAPARRIAATCVSNSFGTFSE
jgi:hypothetical protein